MTTTNDARSRGRYERVTDPAGPRYLLHMVQEPIAALVQTFGTDTIGRSGLR